MNITSTVGAAECEHNDASKKKEEKGEQLQKNVAQRLDPVTHDTYQTSEMGFKWRQQTDECPLPSLTCTLNKQINKSQSTTIALSSIDLRL